MEEQIKVEKEEENTNVVPFERPVKRLAFDDGPTTTPWIEDYDEGTYFLVRQRFNNQNYIEHRVDLITKFDEERSSEVRFHIGDQFTILIVDNERFCSYWELKGILAREI